MIVVSVLLLAVAGFFVFQSSDAAPKLVVYKDAACGCCQGWIEYMESAGYEVESHNVTNMNAVKQEFGVGASLGSCHTAVIDGYVVEGHVPAEDVARMLAERPAIKGISVPGMPIGSPGMEQGPPADYQSYKVVTFDGVGRTELDSHIAGGSNGNVARQ